MYLSISISRQSDWLQRISDCVLGYRLRHTHINNSGGNGGGGSSDGSSGSSGTGSGSNGGQGVGGPITTASASSLSQSHEEALFIRLAWQAEQTQILLGDPPHTNPYICEPIISSELL